MIGASSATRAYLISLAATNTMLAPSAAALACVLMGMLMGNKKFGSANVGDAMNGALCGLVVVTPMAGNSYLQYKIMINNDL